MTETDSTVASTRPSSDEAIQMAFNILLEKKARDVLWLDISRCSDLADAMLIATATSNRQAQSLANELTIQLKAAGVGRLTLAGVESGQWVAADYGDFFVHIMHKNARSFYDLESLWADAKIIAREKGSAADEDYDDMDISPLGDDGDFDDLDESV